MGETPRTGWEFEEDRLVLVYYLNGNYRYEVDLETCTTSAAVLDWVCQLAGKSEGFLSNEHLGQFVRMVDTYIRPQETLCSFGIQTKKGRPIKDVASVIRRNAKRHEREQEWGRLHPVIPGVPCSLDIAGYMKFMDEATP